MIALLGGEFVGQNGDKNKIIDTEDDFQYDQGQQTDPDCRIKQPFHRRIKSCFEDCIIAKNGELCLIIFAFSAKMPSFFMKISKNIGKSRQNNNIGHRAETMRKKRDTGI